MNTYLLALGWWNLAGCIFMFGLFNLSFGKKALNEWTKIFAQEYELNYWSKLWLAWAIGLNIFFAVVNICAAGWHLVPLKQLCIVSDIIAYAMFTALAAWGVKANKCGPGIYSVFIIFSMWIGWGCYVLLCG